MIRKRLLVLLLVCLASLSACGDAGQSGALECSLAIFSAEGTILAEKTVSFTDGDTVLDILKEATKNEKIQMEYTGVGATAYVLGIDNLYEFDQGSESGWIYSVNEEEITTSAGAYKVGEGDVIVWQYSVSP